MVSFNKSFLFGICFASITWIISLCLYWQLTNTQKFSHSLPAERAAIKNNIIVQDATPKFKKLVDFKTDTREKKKALKDYINSVVQNKQTKPDDQFIGELGMVRTKEDKKLKAEGYKLYAYNILISTRLSYHREIPDTRNKLCSSLDYGELPTASVVICFYNEHFQTLLRTLHSIVDRTQHNLLKEIILVDDFSDHDQLHESLQKYIDNTLKDTVKFSRTYRREGLIRARMFGARKATGDVLVFLDSHIEVNKDWLRPLLGQIKKDKSTVAIPIIDLINPDSFNYSASPLVRGGFNWGLHFKWENLPTGTLANSEDFVKPIKTPTMAGGLFAIDRQYFMDMGEYDAGMNIWGGENIEMSFRIWMCGGKLELIPCSRVGHIFRHRRPYGSPDGQDTMLYNSLRVAHVWMDDYKEHFLNQKPEGRQMDYGYVKPRIQLRKDLKCKDFDWYLKNVYPEMTLPSDNSDQRKEKAAALEQDVFQPWHSRKRNYLREFQLRLTNTSLCAQSDKDLKTKGSSLLLKSCIRGIRQRWFETDKSELVLGQLLCLQSGQPYPILYKCHEMGGEQEWHHKGETKTPIYNIAAGTCLAVDKPEHGVPLTMKLCTDAKYATWDLFTT